MDVSRLIRVQAGVLMALVRKTGGEITITHADLVHLDSSDELVVEESSVRGETAWRFTLRKAPIDVGPPPVVIVPPREIEA
jgi:hypothetical protein